jgi:RimJ/RimL family protein N-acetyltransferase
MFLSSLQLTITSKKIVLFQLESSDVGQDYIGWLNDSSINQFLECRFDRHTLETTKKFVSSMNKSEVNLLLGIRYSETGKHVGNIKLGLINKNHGTAEIGLMVGDKSVWSKGIATEAIRMIVDLARGLQIRKLTAGCYSSNLGSKRAFEKNGFEIEGVRKEQVVFNNRAEDLMLFGLVL